jgi:hypothetical protein
MLLMSFYYSYNYVMNAFCRFEIYTLFDWYLIVISRKAFQIFIISYKFLGTHKQVLSQNMFYIYMYMYLQLLSWHFLHHHDTLLKVALNTITQTISYNSFLNKSHVYKKNYVCYTQYMPQCWYFFYIVGSLL